MLLLALGIVCASAENIAGAQQTAATTVTDIAAIAKIDEPQIAQIAKPTNDMIAISAATGVAVALPANNIQYIKPDALSAKKVSFIKLPYGVLVAVKKDVKTKKINELEKDRSLDDMGCSFVGFPYAFEAGTQNNVSIICYNFNDPVPCPEDFEVSAVRGSANIVGENGLFEVVAYSAPSMAGNDTINAEAANFSCSADVNVLAGGLSQMALEPQNPIVLVNGAVYFNATSYDAHGNVLNLPLHYEVSDPEIGFISQDGIFSASAVGRADVVVYYEGQPYADTYVTVVEGGAFCRIVPNGMRIMAGHDALFTFGCYDDAVPAACGVIAAESDVGEITGFEQYENVSIAGIRFHAQNSTGNGHLFGMFNNYTCNASIEIAPAEIVSIAVLPPAVSLDINQSQQFDATGTDAYGNALNVTAIADWSVLDINGGNGNGHMGGGAGPSCNGTMAGGLFTATDFGGCYAVATLGNVSGNASISVNMPHGGGTPAPGPQGGAGGNDGASTGGGVAGFGASVQKECAGKPISLTAQAWGVPVEGARVVVNRLAASGWILVGSGTTTADGKFVLQTKDAGDYVVIVSIGTTESQDGFTLRACTGAQLEAAGATQGAQVNLQESSEQAVLQRTVTYQNGATRKFEVTALPSASGRTDYRTKITLTYKNSGEEDVSGRLRETIPAELLSDRSQLSFDDYPDAIIPDSPIAFEWKVENLIAGREISFAYEFGRAVNDAMIDKYAAPEFRNRTTEEITAEIGDKGGIPFISTAAAAIGNFAKGETLVLGGILLAGIIVLFVIYRMGFGGKRE
jgi:hypothetical protein